MNKLSRMVIVFLLALAALVACKSTPAEPTLAIDEPAYPVDEAYPLEESYFDTGESAYPVKEADLQNLYGTWTLATYLVNGAEETPPSVKITFREDGTYSRETEKGTTEGTWRAEIMLYPQLMLESDENGVQVYVPMTMTAAELRWQTSQDSLIIEESFVPAD